MIKPAFCICENKGADQSCSCVVTAQLIRAFIFAIQIEQSLCFLNLKFKAYDILCGCTAQFVSDLVRYPKDRFSCDTAHMMYDEVTS